MSDSLVRVRQTPHPGGRRRSAAVALAVIAVGALTACGSDASTGAGTTPSTAVTSSSSASSDPSSVGSSSAGTSVGSSSAGTSVGSSSAGRSVGSSSAAVTSSAGLGSECTPASLQTLKSGALTIATSEPAFEPWMVDNDPTNGKGYESAVAYAVADKLGYTKDAVAWTRVGFDEAIAKPDGFDFDINQFSISDARKKQVDFSTGYYDVTQVVITVKGSPIEGATTVAALKSAKLGAMNGTTSLDAVNSVIAPTDKPSVFDDNALAAQALQGGQIDGLVVDLPTGFYMVGAQLKDGAVLGQLAGTAASSEQFGLLLAKDSPLTSCMSAAVDALRADGTLAKLNTEWLAGKDVAPVLQ
ncbi:ABC transporter substrate-binding protein [Nakamurella sp. A5-74]|uniref:ABC transporter substrate-binding protein n=1 Tax=Nakamurella sp. A5-74 TaxID=3158264 RepID=A0AAU8DP33_9ACTN